MALETGTGSFQALFDRMQRIEQLVTSPEAMPGGSSGGGGPNGNQFETIVLVPPGGGPGVTLDTSVPGAPTALIAAPGAFEEVSFVDLSWSPPSSPPAFSYQVELARKNLDNSYAIADIRQTVGTSMRIDGLDPGSDYGFRVAGLSRIGLMGPYSNGGAYTTFLAQYDSTIPPIVTGVAMFRGAASVIVNWNLSTAPDVRDGHGTYEVHLSTNNSFTNIIGVQIASGSVTVFGSINPTGGGEAGYYARVRAIDSSGNAGPWSATASATAGGVTGTMILQDTIDGGHIKTNAITATNIQAGAITTDKLTVAQAGDNKVLNGDFQGATYTAGSNVFPEAWGNLEGAAGFSMGVGAHGVGNAIRIASNAYAFSKGFPVVATAAAPKTFMWSARFLTETTVTSGVYLAIGVFANQGGYVYQGVHQDTQVINNVGGTAGVWNYAEGKVVVTNTGYIVLRPHSWIGASVVRWDELVVREVERAVTIGGGAIQAVHMTANSVYADTIASEQIITGHMEVDSILGDRIKANTLDVGKLLANSILTKNLFIQPGGQFTIGSPPTTGMFMNSGGITLYKAGAQTARLDSVTGNITITNGTLSTANIIASSTITGAIISSGQIYGPYYSTSVTNLGARIVLNSGIAGGSGDGSFADLEFRTARVGGDVSPTSLYAYQANDPTLGLHHAFIIQCGRLINDALPPYIGMASRKHVSGGAYSGPSQIVAEAEVLRIGREGVPHLNINGGDIIMWGRTVPQNECYVQALTSNICRVQGNPDSFLQIEGASNVILMQSQNNQQFYMAQNDIRIVALSGPQLNINSNTVNIIAGAANCQVSSSGHAQLVADGDTNVAVNGPGSAVGINAHAGSWINVTAGTHIHNTPSGSEFIVQSSDGQIFMARRSGGFGEFRFYGLPVQNSGAYLRLGGSQVYADTSSERYKHDIAPLSEIMDVDAVLDALDPISFKQKYWETGEIMDGRVIGLSAEKTHKASPYLVNLDEDGLPAGIMPDKIAVIAAEGVKRLRKRVAELELAVKALKNKE